MVRIAKRPKPSKLATKVVDRALQMIEEDPERILATVEKGAQAVQQLRKNPQARREFASAFVAGVAHNLRRS